MEGISTADSDPRARTDIAPFASVLRAFRTAAELTQEELAERSGVSIRAISDLERGVKTRPQRATVELLVAGLGLDSVQRVEFEAAIPSRVRSTDRVVHSFDLPVGGFLGSVPEGRLVARASEVDRVRELVEIVKDGAGRLLLLMGEPGVGKTRLAQEVTLICRASGMHLTSGQCYEPQQGVAYYPFLEILNRLVPMVQARTDIDPLQRWPQLRPLIPTISGDSRSRELSFGGEGDQQRLFWAVSGLLEAAAEAMPIAVALDDLHWADQSSLELLHHLAHQLRHVPVLLIATYRDTEVDRHHPLLRVLRDLHREHLTDDIAVGRLSLEGTAALMSSVLGNDEVSPGLADLVQRRTEGNAFFVQEIVRMLVERGEALRRDGVWDYRAVDEMAVPQNVYEAIGERLSRLSEAAQELLSEASVLGDTFEFDDLIAMGNRSEEEIERTLEEATRASVIRFGKGDTYAFYHALTQQVLYRDLSPRRRKRLHLSAGQAIQQRPARTRERRAAELAWHFSQGGNQDQALTYAVLAGDQAENRFAHREAERHYHVALELARETLDIAREALVLEKLGRALTNGGQYEHAREVLEQARRLYRQDNDLSGEIHAVIQLSSVHRAMGTSEAAISHVQSLLDRLEENGRPQDIAELNIVLETLCFATGRYREGLKAAERATEITRSGGDMLAFARALTGYGSELWLLGRLDEGLTSLEEAIALPEAPDDPFNLVRALGNAAEGHRLRGNLIRSRELAERSMEVGERIHSPWDTAIALATVGATYRLLGEWNLAREYLERGDKLRRSLPPAWWAIYVIIELGGLYLDEGKWDPAAELVSYALDFSRRSQHLEGIRSCERLMAELDLINARPESARRRLEPLLDQSESEEPQITEILPTLAAAYEAGGDLAQAEWTIEAAIRRARKVNGLLALASALVVRGRLMTARESWDEAERDFAESIRLAKAMPYPHLEARGLFEWGVMNQARGEASQARERLHQALPIFERLGARPYIERTKQALAESDG